MATVKKTTRKTATKRKATTTRKKTTSSKRVKFYGLELSYFLIPLAVLAVWAIDSWAVASALEWVRNLHLSGIRWLDHILWYSAYMYTTIGLVKLWNVYPRKSEFFQIMGALAINLFCFLVEIYLLFVRHSLAGALVFFIGAALSLAYVIYILGEKYRGIAYLFLPYLIRLLVSIYALHRFWMLS